MNEHFVFLVMKHFAFLKVNIKLFDSKRDSTFLVGFSKSCIALKKGQGLCTTCKPRTPDGVINHASVLGVLSVFMMWDLLNNSTSIHIQPIRPNTNPSCVLYSKVYYFITENKYIILLLNNKCSPSVSLKLCFSAITTSKTIQVQ